MNNHTLIYMVKTIQLKTVVKARIGEPERAFRKFSFKLTEACNSLLAQF